MVVISFQPENYFFYGAYKNNQCLLGYCDVNQGVVVAQYKGDNEPPNGIDLVGPSQTSRLLFCTNDDLVASWDYRTNGGGITKYGFRGSNPQDIKSSPSNPHEFAVCDDRKSILVV